MHSPRRLTVLLSIRVSSPCRTRSSLSRVPCRAFCSCASNSVHHNHPVQQPRHGLGLLLVEGLEGGAHDLCAMQRGVVWRE